MLEEILINYQTAVSLGGFVIITTGLYWKVRIDLKTLDLKIAEIQCDRKEKWSKYQESQDKKDACLDEIMKGVSELRGDVKSIKTHIEYLRKK
jgi:hypothetical protein